MDYFLLRGDINLCSALILAILITRHLLRLNTGKSPLSDVKNVIKIFPIPDGKKVDKKGF